MKIGRDWRHLLPALLLSLALHLLFGYGLNVYGNGPATAKVPTRLTLRLARPPPACWAAAAAAAWAKPCCRAAGGTDRAFTPGASCRQTRSRPGAGRNC